jgi:hypothetical protein
MDVSGACRYDEYRNYLIKNLPHFFLLQSSEESYGVKYGIFEEMSRDNASVNTFATTLYFLTHVSSYSQRE